MNSLHMYESITAAVQPILTSVTWETSAPASMSVSHMLVSPLAAASSRGVRPY